MNVPRFFFLAAAPLLLSSRLLGAAGDARPLPSARTLDLALLVTDAPTATRSFTAPIARASRPVDTVSPAASSVLFAAALPTPADLPSVPAGPTPPIPLPSPSTTAAPAGSAATPGGIMLNFQNASLNDVLNYLSSAAGFVIVQEGPVTGTVNLVSRQAITPDEAVELLNTVLVEKGYIALRSGRILKIVPRENAEKRDLPVVTGSDPTQIPRRDNMVTQILPVRYAEVAKLVDSLRPLLSDRAIITSNDSSNAIILTDTQTNIHRIAEIVRALDTSISGIASLRIFSLHYADSKALADIITQLFAPTASTANQGNNRGGNPGGGGFPNFGGFGGFGGRGGGGGNGGRGGNNAQPAAPQSEAREAAARVVAVPDEQSNSVVVAAPEEYMSNIAEVVARLDTSVTDITETRIFRLQFADATELAGVLSSLYSDVDSTSSGNNAGRGNNQGGQGGNRGGNGQQQPQRQTDNRSERALLQTRVMAVADPRTNSVLVSASRVTMEQIAMTVSRLDATDTHKQHVYVHTLTHADPDNVAAILRGMYNVDSSSSQTAQQPSASRLSQRTTSGATETVGDTLNTGSNGRTGR